MSTWAVEHHGGGNLRLHAFAHVDTRALLLEEAVPAPGEYYLVYKPKDIKRDWSPRFYTLQDQNG